MSVCLDEIPREHPISSCKNTFLKRSSVADGYISFTYLFISKQRQNEERRTLGSVRRLSSALAKPQTPKLTEAVSFVGVFRSRHVHVIYIIIYIMDWHHNNTHNKTTLPDSRGITFQCWLSRANANRRRIRRLFTPRDEERRDPSAELEW